MNPLFVFVINLVIVLKLTFYSFGFSIGLRIPRQRNLKFHHAVYGQTCANLLIEFLFGVITFYHILKVKSPHVVEQEYQQHDGDEAFQRRVSKQV